jgi:hypothetical protein
MKLKDLLWSFPALLALTACDAEFDFPDPSAEGDEEVVVTYTVKVPDAAQTRAYSDGTKATNLHYAVYEVVKGEEIEDTLQLSISDNAVIKERVFYEDEDDTDGIKDLGTEVQLHLIKGKTYEIAFWAQSANAPFSYKDKTRTVTYDYENAVANSDNLDAFYAYERMDVKCEVGKSIILNRALAQINFGSNDIADARKMGLRVDRSTIKIPAYSEFNLQTGEVSEQTTMQFRLADVPSDEEFPFIKAGADTSEYSYVAMGYVFVPNDQTLVDITLIVDSEDTFTADFTDVPVQRNYRTNIYGSLFTNTAKYDVTLSEKYRGADYNVSIWDGYTTEIKAPVNHVIEIENAAQLARIAEKSNDYYWNAYSGDTIKLETDIDLAHLHWNSIASADLNENVFLGNIDGNGHKIMNMHIDASTGAAGFIGCIGSAEVACSIKNLTLENVILDNATEDAINFSGALAGYARNTTIDNVTITGDIIINGKYLTGGIVGKADEKTTLSNITINASEGSLVKGTGAIGVGSIAGYTREPLKNVTSNLNVQAESTDKQHAHVGGLVGEQYTSATYEDCSYSGNVYLYNYRTSTNTPNPYNMTIGGLVGSYTTQYATGVFKRCKFTGTIHSYLDGVDKTAEWSANRTYNQYWEWVGWKDAGTPSGTDYTVSTTSE